MTLNEIEKTIKDLITTPPRVLPSTLQNGLIRFTPEERKQMPKGTRKYFSATSYTARYEKYINSDGTLMYKICSRKDGQKITASASTLTDAKRLFIQELQIQVATNNKRA